MLLHKESLVEMFFCGKKNLQNYIKTPMASQEISTKGLVKS
jgi:hypothetical protein